MSLKNKKENNNVVLFKRKAHLNIGIVLFGAIFIYLLITIIIYVSTSRTTSYEVRIGSVLNDTEYTGMALREETVVTADEDGYVNYYNPESSKVKNGSKAYITTSKKADKILSEDSDEESLLSADKQNEVTMLVEEFHKGYTDSNFSSAYNLKSKIASSISGFSSAERYGHLDQLVINDPSDIKLNMTSDDGVIVYSADGYEGLTKEKITPEILSREKYFSKDFYNNMKVSKGDPVYKLITSENWSLIVPISKSTEKELKEKDSINVRFLKDDQIVKAHLTLDTVDNQKMAYLSFDTSMIRYADQRFLEIELILEDTVGLKIPKSSVVDKEVYEIPGGFFTSGGNNNRLGILKKDAKEKQEPEYIQPDIYEMDKKCGYVSTEFFKEGDVLIQPDSNATHKISKTTKMKGVYEINKGYAEFRPVHIMAETNDYYIIEDNNGWGLSNYDHIALKGNKLKENEIIAQ